MRPVMQGRSATVRRGTMAGLTTMLVSLLVALVGPAPTAMAAPALNPGCTPMMAYLVPGTTETSDDADPSQLKGMLAPIGNKLRTQFGDRITVISVPYSASAFDKGLTYKQSATDGVKRLAALMSKCPTSQSVVAGYSQGAEVAGDVLWHIGHENQPVAAANVKAAALLADPKRGNELLVGAKLAGQGVEGGRPNGYGALEGRIKWVCDDADMYCNTTSKNPFVKVLGKTITGNTSDNNVTPLNGDASGEDQLGSLVSNSGGLDLAGAPGTAEELKSRTQALVAPGAQPTGQDFTRIAGLADSLNKTYSTSQDVSKFAADNGADSLLDSQKAGTPGKSAAGVLDSLNGMNLGQLSSDTASMASTANQLAGDSSTASALSNSGELVKSLADKGLSVAAGSSALSATDQANLSTASGVLGQLKVSTVVNTALNGVTTILSTDYQGIAAKINDLGGALQRMDAKAAHADSDTILDKLQPWVDLADSANTNVMPMAAAMIGMIPDPYGACAIASMIMKVMAQIDIKRIVDNVRKAMDVAWTVLEGHPEAAVNLVPIGVDLGVTGVQALSNGLLGSGGAKTGASSAQGVGGGQDLVSMADQLTQSLGGVNVDDLGQLATDGVDFSSFIASGAHTSSYTNKPLVQGMNGVDYIAAYFTVQLGGSINGQNTGAATAPTTGAATEPTEPTGTDGTAPTGTNGDGGTDATTGADTPGATEEPTGAQTPTVTAPTTIDHGQVGPIN